MTKIIISLGGSVYYPKQFRNKYLHNLFKLLSEYQNQYIIVCGGGASARNKIKQLGNVSDETKDLAGIEAINENIMKIADIAYNYFDKLKIVENYKDVKGRFNFIVGAKQTGHSSDWDAVAVARNLKVKSILNLSDTDGIYNKNPKKYKTAKQIKEISWNEYLKLVGEERPGGHYPFDPVASKSAKRSKINVYFVNGNKISKIKKFLENNKFDSIIES